MPRTSNIVLRDRDEAPPSAPKTSHTKEFKLLENGDNWLLEDGSRKVLEEGTA